MGKNKTRVKVEMRRISMNASEDDRYREGASLLRRFKRACNEFGIANLIKEHEFFVRPCDKRRRKRQKRELELKRSKLPGFQQEQNETHQF